MNDIDKFLTPGDTKIYITKGLCKVCKEKIDVTNEDFYEVAIAYPIRYKLIIHDRCKAKHFTDYYCGVPITELENKTCPICGDPFDRKLFFVSCSNAKDGILYLHNNCKADMCPVCNKVIGVKDYCLLNHCPDIIPYKVTSLHQTTGDKINGILKPKIHNTCIYAMTDVKASSRGININDFWPSICNKETFRYHPGEFKSIAIIFLMVIRRLNLQTIINKDLIFVILSHVRGGTYHYPIQNGIKVRVDCKLCQGPIRITRFDTIACTKSKCEYIRYRCGCEDLVPYNANPESSCTEYRCHKIKCQLCNGPIRYAPFMQTDACAVSACNFYICKCICGDYISYGSDPKINCTVYRCREAKCRLCDGPIRCDFVSQTELCSMFDCNYRYNMKCHCGAPVYKLTVNDLYCTVMRCASIIYGERCKCGDNLYKDSNTEQCTPNECRTIEITEE